MKIDRSPQYGESGLFRSTENSGHEGSKSLRVIIIFKPQRFRSLRSRSLRSLRISVFQKSLNIPLSYKIRLNQVRPANKIHPYNQLSEYFFVFLHANLRVFVEIELGNHLFGGGKSLKVGFQTPADR